MLSSKQNRDIPTTQKQIKIKDQTYKAVVIDPSTFNETLANADYQLYNDQSYLPYFAQAAEIIEPGDLQLSLLAQTIYNTERGSLNQEGIHAGLGGINTRWTRKNGKLYPSENGIIFRSLYRTDNLRPSDALLQEVAKWAGLDPNSKNLRRIIFESYHHPDKSVSAKIQAFISTLILYQARSEYGPWIAPLQYATGNAEYFIEQFRTLANSREEAKRIANEVIVDIYRQSRNQPPLYGHNVQEIKIKQYQTINEYGKPYIGYQIRVEINIRNKIITINLDSAQYLMQIKGDKRLGFFDRYNKIVYDQNLVQEEITISQENNQQKPILSAPKIMIMGDSIAQSLASGPAQNIIQEKLVETGTEYSFIGSQWSFGGGVANQAYKGITAIKLYEKIRNGEIILNQANTPDIVIIQLGANEIASGTVSKVASIQENFITPYHNIINSIRKSNPNVIILVSPVPETKLKNSHLAKNMNQALSEMVKILNQDNNYPNSKVILVNNGVPLYNASFVSDDGVHPNQLGINSMSETIAETIKDIIEEINSQSSNTFETPIKASNFLEKLSKSVWQFVVNLGGIFSFKKKNNLPEKQNNRL